MQRARSWSSLGRRRLWPSRSSWQVSPATRWDVPAGSNSIAGSAPSWGRLNPGRGQAMPAPKPTVPLLTRLCIDRTAEAFGRRTSSAHSSLLDHWGLISPKISRAGLSSQWTVIREFVEGWTWFNRLNSSSSKSYTKRFSIKIQSNDVRVHWKWMDI